MNEADSVTVVTYNGVDGACAAAMVLLRYPGAELAISSAGRIGRTLAELASRLGKGARVYVCGVGVHCPWERVEGPAAELEEKGVELLWYCGRGYLERHRERFERFCTPVFRDAGSNTRAACEHLDPSEEETARRLCELARYDPNLEKSWEEPSERQAFWKDLVNASIADYFKYHDEASYVRTIRKLAELRYDEEDRRAVEVFRRTEFKYVLWGKSEPMRELRVHLRKCAEVDEPLLVSGESGVGKEYVAHLVHERSVRATAPFVPVNCALFAGNDSLADSTLFGHVKGAFTGALQDREGAFVSADSGILFLDEVGELPPQVQAKFLRVAEDGRVTPVGSDQPRKVNVRVIAATNRDLADMVREGAFRADLYHRLDVLRIHVPPLRAHIRDVDDIVERLVPRMAEKADAPRDSLRERELEELRDYRWPGNVRQLIKVLKRALYLDRPVEDVLSEERQLGSLTAEAEQEGNPLWPSDREEIRPVREIRDEYALRALELNDGNYSATARMLGIAVNTLRSYVSD
ncbi:MAG: sigma 54-interacting transcriptional regulator [Planctomycetota bacterium]